MRYVVALLLTCLLASTAAADVTYHVRATADYVEPRATTHLSCGASKRMRKDRHRIRMRGHRFWVNGKRWEAAYESALPGAAVLLYQAAPDAYTYVDMQLFADDRRIIGVYTLYGRTEARKPCQDSVLIEGVRE